MTDRLDAASERLHIPLVSGTDDLTAGLLQARALDAPPRPGVLGALDRFEIVHVVGQGGMGVVVLARDPATDVRVAIKMLRPELARQPQVVRRFLTEARHMYRLDHGRILRVLEVSGRANGPYYVMPWKERGSLGDRLRSGEPLDGCFALQIACDVAEALTYAHAQGIIHRDVKPLNVLLDSEDRACLGDFGLLRAFDQNESIVEPGREGRIGTLAYMSPAVARGEAEDTRCDIYSFGALLYEMLTGQPPYTGESREAILAQILSGPPTPASVRNPGAPAGLASIAEDCMARELRDRYASMGDVLADLERVKAGQGPLGPYGRRWQASIRRRRAYAAAIVPAVLLAGGLGYFFWSSQFRANVQTAGEPPASLSPRTAGSDGESDLRNLLTHWPVVFEDALTSESCLSKARFSCSTGMYPRNQAFTLHEGKGLQIGGSGYNVAWWNRLIGTNYAVSFEFRPFAPSEPNDFAGLGVWMNGPGYGTHGDLASRFWIWRDDRRYALIDQGREISPATGQLREPLTTGDWHRIDLVRRGEKVAAWLDGVLLVNHSLPVSTEDPLHRYVGIGAGSGWHTNRDNDPVFRALSIRMPQHDADRLAKLPLEPQFDGRTDRQPEPNGAALFSHDFASGHLAGWYAADSPEDALCGPEGLALNGSGGTPLIWREQTIPLNCAVEFDVYYPPEHSPGCFCLFLATEDPRAVKDDNYHGWSVSLPEMSGRNTICWHSSRTDTANLPWHHYARPRTLVTKEPYFVPIPGRASLFRLEIKGARLSVFSNGRLFMEAEAPGGLRPGSALYVGIGKYFGPKLVRSVRAWRLRPAVTSNPESDVGGGA